MTAALVLQTLSIVLVAFGTSIALFKVYTQYQFERRNTWWSHIEWALDKIASENETDVYVGSQLLPVILESSFRDSDEKELAEAILELTTDDVAEDAVESRKEIPGGDRNGDQNPS